MFSLKGQIFNRVYFENLGLSRMCTYCYSKPTPSNVYTKPFKDPWSSGAKPGIFQWGGTNTFQEEQQQALGCPHSQASGIATGESRGGQSATPDSEKFAKNWEKEGKNPEKLWKKGKNREKEAKIRKLLSLCLSWQIGLGYATESGHPVSAKIRGACTGAAPPQKIHPWSTDL